MRKRISLFPFLLLLAISLLSSGNCFSQIDGGYFSWRSLEAGDYEVGYTYLVPCSESVFPPPPILCISPNPQTGNPGSLSIPGVDFHLGSIDTHFVHFCDIIQANQICAPGTPLQWYTEIQFIDTVFFNPSGYPYSLDYCRLIPRSPSPNIDPSSNFFQHSELSLPDSNSTPHSSLEGTDLIICIDSLEELDFKFVDDDNDSLDFKLVPCESGVLTPVVYSSENCPPLQSFNGSNPFCSSSGWGLNQFTGVLSTKAMSLNGGKVCISVEEFRDGLVLSKRTHEFNLHVALCDSQPALVDTLEMYIDSTVFFPGGNICHSINFEDLVFAIGTEFIYQSHVFDSILGTEVFNVILDSVSGEVQFCWDMDCNYSLGPRKVWIKLVQDLCPVPNPFVIEFIIQPFSGDTTIANFEIVGNECVLDNVDFLNHSAGADTWEWLLDGLNGIGPLGFPSTATTFDFSSEFENFNFSYEVMLIASNSICPGIEADTLIVPFDISEGPVVEAGDDYYLCDIYAVSLNHTLTSVPANYQWSTINYPSNSEPGLDSDGNFNNDQVKNPFYFFGPNDQSGGSACIQLSTADGPACVGKDTVCLYSGESMRPEIQNPGTICGGDSVFIDCIHSEADRESTWLFFPQNSGAQLMTFPNDIVLIIAGSYSPGVYYDTLLVIDTLTTIDAPNCVRLDTIILTRVHVQSPEIQGDSVYCLNDTGQLFIQSSPNTLVNWALSGTGITGSGSNTLFSLLAMEPLPSEVCVNTIDTVVGCGSFDCSSIVVNGLPNPIIDSIPELCEQNEYELFVNTSPGNSLEWIFSDSILGNLHSPGLSSVLFQTVQNGIGVVEVVETDSNGCMGMDSLPITILPGPSIAVNGLHDVCPEAANLAVSVSELPGYLYQWSILSPNGHFVGPSDGWEMFLGWVNNSDVHVQVIVENENGCVDSLTDSISIFSSPQPNISGDIQKCLDGNNEMYWTNNVIGNQYQWEIVSAPLGTLVGPITGNQGVIQWDSSGQGIVVLVEENIHGCINSDTHNVTINPLPVPDIQSAPSFCEGESVCIFTPFHAGNNYSWTTSDSGIVDIQPKSGMDSISCEVNEDGNYFIYIEEVSQEGCYGFDTVQILVNDRPDAFVSGMDTQCENELYTVYSTMYSPGYSYTWEVSQAGGNSILAGPNPSSIYVNWGIPGDPEISLYVEGPNGCSDSVLFQVQVVNGPNPQIIGIDSVCQNTGGHIYHVSPQFGMDYSWNVIGGIDSVFPTQPYFVEVNWTVQGLTSLVVNVTDLEGGCTGHDTLQVFGFEQPMPEIFGSSTICDSEGDPYCFVLNPGPTSTFEWQVTGGTVIGSIDQESIQVDWGNGGPFELVVTETNSLGCSGTYDWSGIITIIPEVFPVIVGDSTVCVNNGSSHYFLDGSYLAQNWEIDPLVGSSILSQTHLDSVEIGWTSSGIYNLIVEVEDNDGCPGFDSLSIEVFDEPYFEIQGPSISHQGDFGQIYSVSPILHNSTWSIVGGTFVQSGDSVIADWGMGAFGVLCAEQEDNNGCRDVQCDTIQLMVGDFQLGSEMDGLKVQIINNGNNEDLRLRIVGSYRGEIECNLFNGFGQDVGQLELYPTGDEEWEYPLADYLSGLSTGVYYLKVTTSFGVRFLKLSSF